MILRAPTPDGKPFFASPPLSFLKGLLISSFGGFYASNYRIPSRLYLPRVVPENSISSQPPNPTWKKIKPYFNTMNGERVFNYYPYDQFYL